MFRPRAVRGGVAAEPFLESPRVHVEEHDRDRFLELDDCLTAVTGTKVPEPA
jgi:hypothetical protein